MLFFVLTYHLSSQTPTKPTPPMDDNITVRVLPRNLVPIKPTKSTLQWLIGSQFHPQFSIISTIRCLNYDHKSDLLSPDTDIEAKNLRSLVIKGFHIIGALIFAENGELGQIAKHAIDCGRKIREVFYGGEKLGDFDLICGVGGCSDGEIRFFVESFGDLSEVKVVESVDEPEKFVWDHGCLIRCEMNVKLPVFVRSSDDSVAIEKYNHANEALIAKFKDPQITFIVEAVKGESDNLPRSVIIRGSELDFETDVGNVDTFDHVAKSEGKVLRCSYFFSNSKHYSSMLNAENADTIQVTAYLNKSEKFQQTVAPVVEYCPAGEDTTLKIVDYKLDVLCYAVKNLSIADAISSLVVPALVDQVKAMKNAISPSFFSQHPQLRPYHFYPPGIWSPITAIYELSYGETELKQVEARRSLHLRLGLHTDRPLFRIANALNFGKPNSNERASGTKGYMLLKDVHLGIPGSGVSGGIVSLVQGSYEYHHYLQDGFDDSGWGCAYRSLQTIISWFKLQHYTSIDVPTHREIQQALVEIGDKAPSFIGSREWIGAIELSYVLDKLLGVTCKVINVRSGAELPEKCRELALHFENQGTPIMIGGGVLAYTLLGVDYNNDSGDCSFLILDPHYTGGEDLKKIVIGGWCGWKKAIDSKGKRFFLQDKFYNLLLPQRPNMV